MEQEIYYTLVTSMTALEWVYILEKQIKDLPDQEAHAHIDDMNNAIIFHLSREKFTPEDIAAFTGLDPKAIADAHRIDLMPMYTPTKYPRPTVDYYGEA